jgi:hypothetical protein
MADGQAQPVGSSAGGKRPGGLTALAVLNFVFGALGLIFTVTGFLALSAAMAMMGKMASAVGASSMPSAGIIYASLGLGIIGSIIEIVAGVGYLGMKKMGKTMGNAYAVLAIAGSVVGIALMHSGFGFGTILGLAYPLLTLYFVNVVYKDTLVN